MTGPEHDVKVNDPKLGELPAPRSPDALDTVILAKARAATPDSSAPRFAPWIAGLSAASVAALALLITLPGEQAQTTGSLRETPPPQSTAYSLPHHGYTATTQPPKEIRGGIQADAKFADALKPPPDTSAQRLAKSRARQPALTASAGQQPGGSDAKADQAPSIQRAALPRLLQNCRDVAAHDKTATPEACYSVLRERCKGCELPETLEEALEAYPVPVEK